MPKTRYVDKVGIELEGGWMRTFPDARIIFDQSIAPVRPTSGRKCTCGDGCVDQTCHWGEIPSPPLPFDEALGWMRDHYPDGVDAHCGFHVHISTKTPSLYAELMNKKFFDHFNVEVVAWAKRMGFPKAHPFWERVTNKNLEGTPARFCNRGYAALQQAVQQQKNNIRRSPLNYCYGQHGTVEARVFPAFPEVEVAEAAVGFYVLLAEEWLRVHPVGRKRVFVATLEQMERHRAPFRGLRA